ncbi:unnamed protein product [Cylindrotheca closterium]|uniref:Uncharacterized protein n=1 Tax=Cylindrotheca closterium TaxID=2856 RepID=A0AAD2JI52_9STRA|nr:unnamed protein product [Cylindrotheca closterium]
MSARALIVLRRTQIAQLLTQFKKHKVTREKGAARYEYGHLLSRDGLRLYSNLPNSRNTKSQGKREKAPKGESIGSSCQSSMGCYLSVCWKL